MRNARREQTRLDAAIELRNWLFGRPTPDTVAALGALTAVRGEVVRFSASFGPRGDATDADGDATAINVSGIATDDEEVIDAEPAESPTGD